MYLFRYMIVGGLAYFLEVLFFVVICYILHSNIILINIVVKILASIFAFKAHQKFTFNNVGEGVSQKYKYVSLLIFMMIFSSVFIYFALLLFNTPIYAKVISDIAAVLVSFGLSKLWVFSARN